MSADSMLTCIAPQCASHPCRSEFLEYAARMLDLTCFSPVDDMAQANVAAHLCTLYPAAGPSGALSLGGGPLTGVREGDTSLTFGFLQGMSANDMFWMKTPYGQQYLSLRDQSACSAPFLAKP